MLDWELFLVNLTTQYSLVFTGFAAFTAQLDNTSSRLYLSLYTFCETL